MKTRIGWPSETMQTGGSANPVAWMLGTITIYGNAHSGRHLRLVRPAYCTGCSVAGVEMGGGKSVFYFQVPSE